MERRMENVVFDIGGVLLDTRTEVVAAALGVSADQLRVIKRLAKESGLWDAWILGDVNGDEFEDRLCLLMPDRANCIHKWVTAAEYTGGMPLYGEVWMAMRQLSTEGRKIFFLSNIVDRTLDYLRDERVVTTFSGGVYSCEVGLAKPDHTIFQLLLDKYELEPAETVFFDDKFENVAAAREVGIQAHHWQSIKTLRQAFPFLS